MFSEIKNFSPSSILNIVHITCVFIPNFKSTGLKVVFCPDFSQKTISSQKYFYFIVCLQGKLSHKYIWYVCNIVLFSVIFNLSQKSVSISLFFLQGKLSHKYIWYVCNIVLFSVIFNLSQKSVSISLSCFQEKCFF